jgi:hypothetical protein
MKVSRLSEKKIHIKCNIKILVALDKNECMVIDDIDTRFVYRKAQSVITSPISYGIVVKDGFLSSLCNKYQIKKKFVNFNKTGRLNINISEGDDVAVETYSILFSDKEWYVRWNREQQLKKLLE